MPASRHRSPRGRVIVALLTVAIAAACDSEVRSLSPAITDQEAIAMPAIVGTWVQVGDSTPQLLQIVRVPDDSSRYGVRFLDPDSSSLVDSITYYLRMPRDVAQRIYTAGGWFEARVGRLGDQLVVEMTPAPDDTLLEVAESRLSPLVLHAFQLRALTVTPTELTIAGLRADSARRGLRAGRCETPYARDTTLALLLTGDSPQVRQAYACFLGDPRVRSAVLRYRRRP